MSCWHETRIESEFLTIEELNLLRQLRRKYKKQGKLIVKTVLFVPD